MENPRDLLIQAIRERADLEAMRLAGEFARAASEDREAILAALEIEQWVADTCEICLDGP